MATMQPDKKYSEIWVPGFRTEAVAHKDSRLHGCKVGDNKICMGMESKELVVYCGADHGFSLDPAMPECLVVEDSFIFGLLHEHLEQIDVLLAMEYIPKECWE